MTRSVPGDRRTSQEVWVHYDKYDGRLLGLRPQVGTTAGDWLMAWLFPLHAGWFGGQAVKVLWAALAISFPLLSISGVVMWWNRVVTPRRVRARRGGADGSHKISPSSGPPAGYRTTV